ncbi:MAG: hypothetical protein JXR76_29065 [Deltaproteobacteria bacterium]|nr:hypothetical protein [Deltaproteobacteria bacterium]
MNDGPNKFEFPFNIENARTFTNEITKQYLVRGRAGAVKLQSHGASINTTTRPFDIIPNIKFSETKEILEGAEILFRIPLDYSDSIFKFDCRTFTKNGAVLEVISSEVEIVDAIYAVPIPSIISGNEETTQHSVYVNDSSHGDMSNVFLPANDSIAVSDWQTTGELTFALGVAAKKTNYPFSIQYSESTLVNTQLVIENTEKPAIYTPEASYYSGDTVNLQVALSTNDLVWDAITLDGDECIKVNNVDYVDTGTVVFNISICTDLDIVPSASQRQLILHNQDKAYSFFINVMDSGVLL